MRETISHFSEVLPKFRQPTRALLYTWEAQPHGWKFSLKIMTTLKKKSHRLSFVSSEISISFFLFRNTRISITFRKENIAKILNELNEKMNKHQCSMFCLHSFAIVLDIQR